MDPPPSDGHRRCRVEGPAFPAPGARSRMEVRGLAGRGGRRAPPELLGGVARSRSPRSSLPWPGARASRRRGVDGGRRKRISAVGSRRRVSRRGRTRAAAGARGVLPRRRGGRRSSLRGNSDDDEGFLRVPPPTGKLRRVPPLVQ